MFKRLSGLQLLILLLAVLAAVTYIAKRKLPPFEAGLHDITVEAQGRSEHASSPVVGGCPVFPADNVWNTTIDKLPRDSHSDAYIDTIGAAKKVHPDFGSGSGGVPYTLIPKGTRGASVDFEYRDDSDLGHYPIPDDAPIEAGGPQGDRHILAIDPARCLLYELFAADHVGPGEWKAGSGAKYDLTGNSLRDEGKTSADAAGLPIFPGLVRYDEVKSGAIHHALRFTVPKTQAAFIWPARHLASRIKDTNYPPMGQRFRLRADYDISRFSPANQVILKAMKTYGMFLADNGGAMFITGVPDKRWDDEDLHHLGDVHADDFEAVDETSLQMLAASARVDPLATH